MSAEYSLFVLEDKKREIEKEISILKFKIDIYPFPADEHRIRIMELKNLVKDLDFAIEILKKYE